MKNVWMLYSVSVLRIERMLKIDSCSVWFASTTMKEKTTASNNMHIQKHIQLNALPQMLPSRFHFSIEWASTQQNLEKKVCCEHVALILFVYIFFCSSPCSTRHFFVCSSSHLLFSQCVFHLCIWFFECALCALKWNERARCHRALISIQPEKLHLAKRQFFLVDVELYFAWKFGRNWMAHRNWTDLYYIIPRATDF